MSTKLIPADSKEITVPVSSLLLPGFELRKSGQLTIDASVTDDKLVEQAGLLNQMKNQVNRLDAILCYSIGSLIFEYASRKEVTREDAVQELGLCQDPESEEFRRYRGWSILVEKLPEKAFDSRLTPTHLQRAVAFATPTEKSAAEKFNSRRLELLDEAAEKGHSTGWMQEQMRKLSQELGNNIRIPLKQLLIAHVITSEMKERSDEELLAIGVDIADVSSYHESYRNELIERNLISPDISKMVVPWLVKKSDLGASKDSAEFSDDDLDDEKEDAANEDPTRIVPFSDDITIPVMDDEDIEPDDDGIPDEDEEEPEIEAPINTEDKEP